MAAPGWQLGLEPGCARQPGAPRGAGGGAGTHQKAAAGFPHYAVPRSVCLTLEPWTIENTMMTPPSSSKRNNLMHKFAADIGRCTAAGSTITPGVMPSRLQSTSIAKTTHEFVSYAVLLSTPRALFTPFPACCTRRDATSLTRSSLAMCQSEDNGLVLHARALCCADHLADATTLDKLFSHVRSSSEDDGAHPRSVA